MQFSVPEDYQGVIFNENKKPLNEEAERNLKATGTFKSFTYWNYDKTPSRNDALAKVVDWIDISDVVSKIFCKIKFVRKDNLLIFHLKLHQPLS